MSDKTVYVATIMENKNPDTYMTAKEFVAQVEYCSAQSWRNSDIWTQDQRNMELIATHYRECAECRQLFDDMAYPEQTLIDLANHHGFEYIFDWILPNEEHKEALEK